MTLTIAGGYYREMCLEPKWDEFYGSGGRAAAALSGRDANLIWYTYCEPRLLPEINYFCKNHGIEGRISESEQTPIFEYEHWLSTPNVSFRNNNKLLDIESENVLRFGFIEGDAVVNAKKAVYDPQSPESCNFWENGSYAEELAIVCNYGQGRYLTGEDHPEKIARALFGNQSVAAVVLKNAWNGLWVFSRRDKKLIKPTLTSTVHKIGTGDIFSAEFAYAWIILGKSVVESAEWASYRTAVYCDNSGVMPLPLDKEVRVYRPPAVKREGDCRFDVYLAGSGVSEKQISRIEEAFAIICDAGINVFSPYLRNEIRFPDDTAQVDQDALSGSRIVFAIFDKEDPWMMFQIGFARAFEIPVLVYQRPPEDNYSVILDRGDCEIVRDFGSAIYRSIWWAAQP